MRENNIYSVVSNIFLISPRSLGKWSSLTLALFFKWVGEKPPTRYRMGYESYSLLCWSLWESLSGDDVVAMALVLYSLVDEHCNGNPPVFNRKYMFRMEDLSIVYDHQKIRTLDFHHMVLSVTNDKKLRNWTANFDHTTSPGNFCDPCWNCKACVLIPGFRTSIIFLMMTRWPSCQ